jgi:hypothetical protein
MSALGCATTVYAVAVAANYPWELAESPLYEGMGDFGAMWWHCFVASLGDGLLVLFILAAGWIAFGRTGWFVSPGVAGYGLMLAVGLVIAVAVEWIALRVERWSYAATMPLVPGLGVGVVPVAQMVVLPPLVFRIARSISKRIEKGDKR